MRESIPGKGRYSLQHSVHTGSEAHHSPNQMSTVGKAARE
jgi:hypothetical protein